MPSPCLQFQKSRFHRLYWFKNIHKLYSGTPRNSLCKRYPHIVVCTSQDDQLNSKQIQKKLNSELDSENQFQQEESTNPQNTNLEQQNQEQDSLENEDDDLKEDNFQLYDQNEKGDLIQGSDEQDKDDTDMLEMSPEDVIKYLEQMTEKVQSGEIQLPSEPQHEHKSKSKSKSQKDQQNKVQIREYYQGDKFHQLPEKVSYYQQVLTDDMVQKDPVDHRSGYLTIIGLPNVGKSTLMNQLLGQKLSIVTPKAQTTRKRVLGILSSDQYQVVMLDTPGVILSRRNELDRKMMAYVQRSMKQADALLALIDATKDAEDALRMIQLPEGWNGPPMAVAINKVDLLNKKQQVELKEWFLKNCRCDDVFMISALRGSNLTQVIDWAVSKMPQGPTLYPKDMLSELPERFFVEEIIRETIFLQYASEIPYATEVKVQEFKERSGDKKDYVKVQIICERPSQRNILIGKKGSALFQLSTSARLDIEEFLERSVYLEIKVQVQSNWRKNLEILQNYGY